MKSNEPAEAPSTGLWLARGLLLLLAFVLPFEAPLFRAGPLLVTSVELALYATLAAWGFGLAWGALRGGFSARALSSALRDDRLVRAATVWIGVLFVSALAAPSYRAAALKFALRSLSGVLLFFAVRALARPPEVGRRVLFALVGGALLSGVTAFVDWLVPSSATLWRLFREGEFDALGVPRASGAFGYPTIGAMYWEAIVPLLIVAPVLREPNNRRRFPWAAGIAVSASALLIGAILLSSTRSALAGVLVACVAMMGLAWRRWSGVSRVAAAVLGVLLALSAVTLRASSTGSPVGERLRFWQGENWLQVEYMLGSTPRVVPVGATFEVPFAARNKGRIAWRRAGQHPTHVSYHWERILDDSAPSGASTTPAVGEFDGLRTPLPADVSPGATVRVMAVVRGPATPGSYWLRWDLVQEGITWFADRGNPTPEARIEVTRTAEPTSATTSEIVLPPANPPPPSRPSLWRAAVLLWRERPLCGIGPDNFRRRYDEVLRPVAGAVPYADTRLHANSMYFETLADMGLLGLAAIVLLASALVLAIRAHWRNGHVAGLGFGVAAGTFFVHGAADYFLEFTPLFCLFWLLLGVTATDGQTPASGARRSSTL